MLTEEQIEHYYREGYVLLPGLIPRPVIEEVLAAARVHPKEVTGDKWQSRIFDHENPLNDAAIHRLLVEPNVVAAAHDLLSSEPRVWYGMLAIVPANGGNGLPWHQDNMYTTLLGGALNVFIALSEITPEKANLWIAPRSHRYGILPAGGSKLYGGAHREAVTDPENGFCLPTLQPGDACIFDRNTLHRSLQNHTDTDRYAYAAQYQSDHARRAEDGKKDPKRMRARDLGVLFARTPADTA
jgi:ectoine hydroxylase-related dioxygenase (phytanoyl-CoA dioxygenase family)